MIASHGIPKENYFTFINAIETIYCTFSCPNILNAKTGYFKSEEYFGHNYIAYI